MLTIQNLTCRRGGRVIFHNVGFTIDVGDFMLITGINGSGKSSLLRMLAGLIPPLSGEILWNNKAINEDAPSHRARLHYIGHLDAVKLELTVFEMLRYWCALRGIASIDLDQHLKAFALSNLSDRKVRSLSVGQRRRLSLSRLVLDSVPLWILDEPTTALDRDGEKLLWNIINKHRDNGGLVIAAMHDEPNILDIKHFEMSGP